MLLEDEIPRLRRYARALCWDRNRADDLVQTCITRAIAKQHLWQPGTSLRAWRITMLHNQHVSELRRLARHPDTVWMDVASPLCGVEPHAFDRLQLRDVKAAIGKLNEEQRQAVLLVGMEEMSYDKAATILGIPTGTLRSRLSRARDQLRVLMDMEASPPRSALDSAQRERRAA